MHSKKAQSDTTKLLVKAGSNTAMLLEKFTLMVLKFHRIEITSKRKREYLIFQIGHPKNSNIIDISQSLMQISCVKTIERQVSNSDYEYW